MNGLGSVFQLGDAVLLYAAEGSVALTGTAVPSLTEAEVVTGGKTLILTLTGDVWVASGAVFNAVRQAIINGITSAQGEATGWNAEVRDNMAVTAVVRTSDTVVTVTLPASASYAVGAKETITVTVPASALVEAPDPLVAAPTFQVLAGGGSHTGRLRRMRYH